MPLEVSELTRHVTLITIDNAAKRNALSRPMLVELAGLWERLDASDTRLTMPSSMGKRHAARGKTILWLFREKPTC